MKKNIALFIICTFISTCLIAQTITVSEDEARLNTMRYIKAIMGGTEPTISDYYKYYGHHSEYEVAEEMHVCEKVWKLKKDECLKFHKHRFSSQELSSLYLNRLRNNLPHNPTIKFKNINIKKYTGNFCAYVIRAELNNVEVEFLHDACEVIKSDGTVSISKISGIDIDKIIKPRW